MINLQGETTDRKSAPPEECEGERAMPSIAGTSRHSLYWLAKPAQYVTHVRASIPMQQKIEKCYFSSVFIRFYPNLALVTTFVLHNYIQSYTFFTTSYLKLLSRER